jgi:hypothetical protein
VAIEGIAERVKTAFTASARPPDTTLFGDDITLSSGNRHPERWPADWRAMDSTTVAAADWNSLSPDGLAYFLPALLLAATTDIGCAIRARMALIDGLTDFYAKLDVRFGGIEGTWLEMRARRWARLRPDQAGLVVDFLLEARDHVATQDDERRRIEEALSNFWLGAAARSAAAFWAAHGRMPKPPAVTHAPPPAAPEGPALEGEIRAAFTTACYPGDANLRGSDMGCEPYEIEAVYKGRDDWRELDAAFVDRAGLGFLSPEAFRFYLPAFLLADIAGALMTETPWFRLSHGLDDVGKIDRVNPRLYGELTWFEEQSARFAAFTPAEARAVVGYLAFVLARDGDISGTIAQAIDNFWRAKADG